MAISLPKWVQAGLEGLASAMGSWKSMLWIHERYSKKRRIDGVLFRSIAVEHSPSLSGQSISSHEKS